MKKLLLSLSLIGALLLGAGAAVAGPVGIIVPAYFYPGSGGPGNVGDGWAAMASAASQVPITAILNPNSGPGSSADSNYVSAASNLEAAGGKVVAYVYTNNGSTALSSVESQISTYISQYGNLINGFFIDGANIVPSTLTYYQNINNYVHGLNSSYTVIANPGQPYLNGLTPQQYLSTANVFNIFENPATGSSGFSTYPYGQTWYQAYPSADFSNMIYGVTSASTMQSVLSSAISLNAGSVYITNSNSYASLPSYWTQEVSAVAAANSVPTPAPAAVGLLALATFGMLLFKRKNRASLAF